MAEGDPPPEGGGEKKSIVPSGVQKKLGPLPIWLWVVAVAGAVGLGLYLRNRGSSSSAIGTAAPSATDPAQALAADPAANDPMSHSDLLSALGSLISQASAARASNGGISSTSLGTMLGRTSEVATGKAGVHRDTAVLNTSHTAGGVDTQRLSTPPVLGPPIQTVISRSVQKPRLSWFGLPVQGPYGPMETVNEQITVTSPNVGEARYGEK